jgi:hypothetical protein
VDGTMGMYARLLQAEVDRAAGRTASACDLAARVRELWRKSEPAFAELRARADRAAEDAFSDSLPVCWVRSRYADGGQLLLSFSGGNPGTPVYLARSPRPNPRSPRRVVVAGERGAAGAPFSQ